MVDAAGEPAERRQSLRVPVLENWADMQGISYISMWKTLLKAIHVYKAPCYATISRLSIHP